MKKNQPQNTRNFTPIRMKLWLNHPALWERMQDDCFQLIRGVRNPYEGTLYLRTRAERISVMLLLHLTLILQKPMSVHTQWVTTPCVSVRVRWRVIYITSVSHAVQQTCLPVFPPPHTCVHTHTHNLSLLVWYPHSYTQAQKKRNPPLPHIFQIARATTSTHKHIWRMQLNLGQLQQRALLWVKSSITPHEEECLVDHKKMWKQNT